MWQRFLYHQYNVSLVGYSTLDIGHSNVQCPISNIRLNSRSLWTKFLIFKTNFWIWILNVNINLSNFSICVFIEPGCIAGAHNAMCNFRSRDLISANSPPGIWSVIYTSTGNIQVMRTGPQLENFIYRDLTPRQWNCHNCYYNFTEICSSGSNQKYSGIGSDNGFVPTRWQAIIWTNDG